MRIQELFISEATVAPAQSTSANPQTANDPNAPTDVRLAAALQGVEDLRKQLKTVQDGVALSMNQASAPQQATPATKAPPKPGEAGQGQAAIAPAGPGQSAVNPTANPQAGQPMGQTPAAQQPQAPQGQQTTPPAGVTKPAPAIKQELLRQIARNQ